MTPAEKRKFQEAVDEIERREGTDVPLPARTVLRLLHAQFVPLLIELNDALRDVGALRLITEGRSPRTRRPSPAQLRLAIPGLEETRIPATIRIPPTTRKGGAAVRRRGRWAKTLEVPVRDYGLWLRREEELLKNASERQRESLKGKRMVYSIARAGAKGDLTMPMKDALATQTAKRKAKLAGLGSGWLFAESATE